jgi:type I restriction-modification system DNA methylase subunit
MPPVNQEQAREKLQALVETYRALPAPDLESESNVRANFIDPLFELLGWPVRNPVHYNREEYVRGAGFVDIALKVDSAAADPLIFVEAKRFKAIDSLNRVQEKRNHRVAQLRLELPGMSVDRTREEQQAINYAYQKGMQWAVLTNFEHLRLFNARRDTLVLSFDGPFELLERFDELWQLAFAEVRQGSLEGLRAHRERLDIDEEYLRLINVWRLRLGQDIVSHRENRLLLTDPHSQKIDVYKLRDAVQRILDRLVVIRYAEDRLVIRPDQMWAMVEIQGRTDYGFPLLDQIRNFFQIFNVRHNGSLFAEHLCDRLTVTEDVLKAVIVNLYDARFRAMSADIMGNTYEQYLGQTLALQNGDVKTVDNLETRKAQGSYYTPEYVVRTIVDQTLGRYLYGTTDGRPNGEPVSGQTRKRIADIDGSHGPILTILDPACGSGSFLMNVYHVLEAFYADEIKRLNQEREQRLEELSQQGLSPIDLRIELASYKQQLDRLNNYQNQILERHLYGVDLDPQAAELASVNLMLRAMTRDMRLPLILNQNVKIGNSLLAGVQIRGNEVRQRLEPMATQLAELRRIRLAQQGIAQDKHHPIELQGQFERLAHQVNDALNEGLAAYFGEQVAEKRPFNWVVEFPEIFINEEGHLRDDGGFTFVLGNPPYLSVDDTWGQKSPDADHLSAVFPEIWAGKSDIYYYFIRRGLSLCAPHGQLGFITARYYLEAYYAQKLRQVILNEAAIRQIVDFGDYTVFHRVGTKTCITLLQREPDEMIRQATQFLCDKVAHKKIDASQFLQTFQQTAHHFRQSELDSDSWNLYGEAVAQIIDRIDAGCQLLGTVSFIGQGMQTGRNSVFIVDQETLDRYRIEPELIRRNVKNQDIKPYNLAFRGLYLIYPEAVADLAQFPQAKAYLEEHRASLEERAAYKRGDCEWWRFTWPLHKERYHLPKILTPFIAPENRFALDSSGSFVGLTDSYAIFPTDESPDLYYLLALLNSRLLNFRYRFIGKAKDYRYEYFENGLAKIPIRRAAPEVEAELIALAQQVTDLNFGRQAVYDTFRESVAAMVYTRRDFYGAYVDHSEYRGVFLHRVGASDANAQGTVTAIQIDEVSSQLVFQAEVEGRGLVRLITLDIPDDDLRHFLLLALRVDLIANERKQVWSRGRLLQGVLQALELPVFAAASASANLERIRQLTTELRGRVTTLLQSELRGRDQGLTDPLQLGLIEARLIQVQDRIDQLVFALYGIDSAADQQLIAETVHVKRS